MVRLSRLIVVLLAGVLIGADVMLGFALWFNIGSTSSQVSSIPVVNQQPTARNIIIEWTMYESGQDKFVPDLIVINQGDSVVLVFISNDTDAHTFSVTLPTGFFQLNASGPGMTDPLTGKNFTTPATGCFTDGKAIPCDNKGRVGSLVATGTFSVNKPGIYEFTCVYHPPMFGFLVVLPNAGYKQSALIHPNCASEVMSSRSVATVAPRP